MSILYRYIVYITDKKRTFVEPERIISFNTIPRTGDKFFLESDPKQECEICYVDDRHLSLTAILIPKETEDLTDKPKCATIEDVDIAKLKQYAANLQILMNIKLPEVLEQIHSNLEKLEAILEKGQ